MQVDHILAQLSGITSYLSGPDAQSRQSDEHLFIEELETSLSGLAPHHASNTRDGKTNNSMAKAYIAEVSSYIDGVKKNVGDLRTRFEEVKLLNDIQLECIRDLRRELREAQMKSAVEDEKGGTVVDEDEEEEEEEIDEEMDSTFQQGRGVWVAWREAIDAFGEAFFEW